MNPLTKQESAFKSLVQTLSKQAEALALSIKSSSPSPRTQSIQYAGDPLLEPEEVVVTPLTVWLLNVVPEPPLLELEELEDVPPLPLDEEEVWPSVPKQACSVSNGTPHQ